MIENSPKGTQILFMKLLIHLAKMDDAISEEEIKIIDKFSKSLNIPWKDLNQDWELDKILSQFESSEGKVYMIVELMRLAYSDGTYDNLERETIFKIAKNVKISEDFTEKIENWVKKEFNLKNEFMELLNSEAK